MAGESLFYRNGRPNHGEEDLIELNKRLAEVEKVGREALKSLKQRPGETEDDKLTPALHLELPVGREQGSRIVVSNRGFERPTGEVTEDSHGGQMFRGSKIRSSR